MKKPTVKQLMQQLADVRQVLSDLQEERGIPPLWSVSIEPDEDSEYISPYEFLARAKTIEEVVELATGYMRDAYDGWEEELRFAAKFWKVSDDRLGVLPFADAIEHEIVLNEAAAA